MLIYGISILQSHLDNIESIERTRTYERRKQKQKWHKRNQNHVIHRMINFTYCSFEYAGMQCMQQPIKPKHWYGMDQPIAGHIHREICVCTSGAAVHVWPCLCLCVFVCDLFICATARLRDRGRATFYLCSIKIIFIPQLNLIYLRIFYLILLYI